ncbi:MAG: ATP-binding protein [Nitrospirota bacterium]
MNWILQWSLNSFFIFYGLAFFVMAIIILLKPKKGSGFKLADILWLLAGFGLVHGINEWLSMWVLIEHQSRTVDLVKMVFLVGSFIFLFEFGKQLLLVSFSERISEGQKKLAGYFTWGIYLAGALIVLFSSVSEYSDFWIAGGIWARYLLGFPAALLAGLGLLSYYRHEENIKEAKAGNYFLWAGSAFIIYSVLSGLIVPKGDFFPSNWLNTDSFLETALMPVQAVRAVLAIIITVTITGMMKIFDWETKKALELKIEKITALNEELQAFVYSVSHDLRNPLTVIGGFSRLLMKNCSNQLDDKGRENLNTIREETEKMNRYIDELLAFSRSEKQEMKLEDIDMAELVRNVLEELKSFTSDKTAIRIKELPSVHGDPILLRQVLYNLIANALKFTKYKEAPAIEIGCSRRKNELICYVKDNGAGFDMAQADKLFKIFHRLHRGDEFEGTGLGLAICQRIINRHGGKMWAQAKVNEGASFYFSLPEMTG